MRLLLAMFGLMMLLPVGCTDSGTSGDQAATDDAANNDLAPASDEDLEMANETPPDFGPAPEGKLLRHAVFFSFKEDSSEDDVRGVVDAFRELPSKISEIIDFEWGTNNSPEGFNDGFTHCFLLTFKDEAGRAAYLPHDAHKAFGDVLRPHMKDVFVIDYWGNADQPKLDKELKHAVFFRFKEDASPDDIKKVEEGFAALPSKINTIKAFEWGKNNSPEKHDDGFTHAFMVSFESEEDRDAYLPHPEHLAYVEILKPVLDAPRVLDFWAEK